MVRKQIKKYWFKLLVGLILPGIAALCAQDVGARIGEAIVRQTDIRSLLLVTVIGFLVYTLMRMFWGIGKKLLNDTSTAMECEIKKAVYDKILLVEYKKLAGKKPEELYMNFNGDVGAALSMYTDDLYEIIYSLIVGTGIVILILVRSILVAIVVLFIVVGVVLVNMCYVERFTNAAGKEREFREEGIGILSQMLRAGSIIRVLKLQDPIKGQYEKNTEEYYAIRQEQNKLEVKKALNLDWLVYSCATMILPVSCLLVSMSKMDLADVIYIIQLTGNIIWSTSSLGTAWLAFNRKKIAFNALEEFMAMPEEEDEENRLIQPKGQTALAFEDVTIQYGNTIVMQNCSFYCERGHITAIVGRSGTGKSSIINAILGFAEYSGTIRVWDEVVSKSNIKAVRRSIAYMSEDCEMDDTSVEESVCFGWNMADDSIVKERIAEFGLGEIDNAVTASGGEKQKIAFLRAYVKDSDIYILDEPTAALDEKNEERIIDHIKELQKRGKTVFVVTHRERIKMAADKVIEL